MCEFTVNQIISAIAAPILIVLLVLVLIVLVSKRNKTDTLASLAYELQNLVHACKKHNPDLKELRFLDSAGAKCALLCDRAVGQQNQDIGPVPDHIAAARKILSALYAAKTPASECDKYLDLAVIQLESAYSFLINTRHNRRSADGKSQILFVEYAQRQCTQVPRFPKRRGKAFARGSSRRQHCRRRRINLLTQATHKKSAIALFLIFF